MTFGVQPEAIEGTIAPAGGCPFSFFTSRKWNYSTAGLAVRDHTGQRLVTTIARHLIASKARPVPARISCCRDNSGGRSAIAAKLRVRSASSRGRRLFVPLVRTWQPSRCQESAVWPGIDMIHHFANGYARPDRTGADCRR
jgi:hypothetical protein